MIDQLPAIIVLSPLFGALLIGLVGFSNQRACVPIALFALSISFAAALGMGQRVLAEGVVDYFIGGWETPLGIGIQLRVDAMNLPILIAIAIVSILVAIFSVRRIGEPDTEKTPYFYVLFLLLCVGLFGITITGDAFNLFVLIEVSALTSYGLVAMGNSRRGKMAAFHYLLMGTVGASFYLLGVGYLYLKAGSLNIQDLNTIITTNEVVGGSRAITTAFIFILIGIWIKMAFFPLYGWLPNAYSYCPSSSSCILAPLMTKISVYVMIRIMVSLFGLDWVFGHPGWSDLVVWLAVIAILAGSMLALAQRELKKMLCYLIVAEIGYMVGGTWLADPDKWGITGALYHILADAAMTLCLFLAAGIFTKRLGVFEISDLGGLFRKMPLTSVGFIVAALAMIGVPPTAGFFSKFYLIRGGMESGHWEYVAALLISSLVNAVLFFRIFEIAYFGKNPAAAHGHGETDLHGDHGHEESALAPLLSREAPLSALIPLLTTAAIIILLGLFNGQIVEFIRSAFTELPAVVSSLR